MIDPSGTLREPEHLGNPNWQSNQWYDKDTEEGRGPEHLFRNT
jgi:hypothetical protein